VLGLVLLLVLFFENRSPTIVRDIEDLCDQRKYAEAHALANTYLEEGLAEFLEGTMSGMSEEELSDKMLEHGFPEVLLQQGKIELLYADYIPGVTQVESIRAFRQAIEFDPSYEARVVTTIEDHIQDTLKTPGSKGALAKQMLEECRMLMANHDYANIPNVLGGSSLGGDASRDKASAAVEILSHFDKNRAQTLQSKIVAASASPSDPEDRERVQAASLEAREELLPELIESLHGLTVEDFRRQAGADPGYIIPASRPYGLILPKGLLFGEIFQSPPFSEEEVALFEELARCYALQWSTDHVPCTSDEFRWTGMIDLAMKHPEPFLGPLLEAAQVDSDLAVELLRRTPGTVHTPGMNKWVPMPDTFDATDSHKIVRAVADRYASFLIDYAAQDELNLSYFWWQYWRGPKPNYLVDWLLDRDPTLAEEDDFFYSMCCLDEKNRKQSNMDRETWEERRKASQDSRGQFLLSNYLRNFPDGRHASESRRVLGIDRAAVAEAPSIPLADKRVPPSEADFRVIERLCQEERDAWMRGQYIMPDTTVWQNDFVFYGLNDWGKLDIMTWPDIQARADSLMGQVGKVEPHPRKPVFDIQGPVAVILFPVAISRVDNQATPVETLTVAIRRDGQWRKLAAIIGEWEMTEAGPPDVYSNVLNMANQGYDSWQREDDGGSPALWIGLDHNLVKC
jgi:hypothetical protein